MGFVGLGTVNFILTFVLPKMTELFLSMGDRLPLPTVILMNLSDLLNKGRYLDLHFFSNWF